MAIKVKTIFMLPPPKIESRYLAIAFWSPGGWWKILPEMHKTPDEAVAALDGLGRGWVHGRVLEIPD